MADAGHHGDARGVDRFRDALLVERPQVLQAAAAAPDDDDVNEPRVGLLLADAEAVQQAEGGGDLLGGALALDADGTDPHFRRRPAPAQDLEHVAHRRPGAAGDQADAAREARQRALAARVEPAADRELLLELAEGQLQRADALGLHFLDEQLVLAAGGVDAEPAAGDDFQAVAQVELHAQGEAAVEGDLERRFLVLEGEVNVAGRRAGQVGDLALDPDVGVSVLQESLDRAGQLSDREHLDAGGREQRAHGCPLLPSGEEVILYKLP